MRLVKLGRMALATFWTFIAGAAFAALPPMEEPTRGPGSGIRETAQNHLFDYATMAGLIIAAVGFIVVAYHAIGVFGEVQNGKKKWSDFGLVLTVGIILLIIVIWLLTKGTEIL
jgi:integrating conjugative element membrane protein (TIGR03745 family)